MAVDAQRELFVSWLRENGAFVNPHLDVFHEFKDTGRGVLATSAISAGELLISIPSSVYMSPMVPKMNDAFNGRSPQLYEMLRKRQANGTSPSPWASCILQLLHHLSRKDSFFQPYLSLLPDTYDTLACWNRAELSELSATSLAPLIDADAVATPFVKNILPMLKENPDVFPESTHDVDNFIKMTAIISSRGFHSKDGSGPYLVPVADMFDHSSKHASTILEQHGDAFVMKAKRQISAGEQIFNTYGDQSNAQLLSSYGFVEANNPHDSLLVPCDVVFDTMLKIQLKENATDTEGISADSIESQLKAKRELLQDKGIIPPDFFILTKECLVTDELLTAMQVGMLLNDRAYLMYARRPTILGDAVMDDDDMDALAPVLLDIVEACRQRYPNDLVKDLDIQKRPVSYRQKCAVSIRIGEQLMLLTLTKQLHGLQQSIWKMKHSGSEEDTVSDFDSDDDGDDEEGEEAEVEERAEEIQMSPQEEKVDTKAASPPLPSTNDISSSSSSSASSKAVPLSGRSGSGSAGSSNIDSDSKAGKRLPGPAIIGLPPPANKKRRKGDK